jgi:hypothetical protein
MSPCHPPKSGGGKNPPNLRSNGSYTEPETEENSRTGGKCDGFPSFLQEQLQSLCFLSREKLPNGAEALHAREDNTASGLFGRRQSADAQSKSIPTAAAMIAYPKTASVRASSTRMSLSST